MRCRVSGLLEWDIALVARDVQHAYIARDTARQGYGVVCKGASLAVDLAATQALRRVRLPGKGEVEACRGLELAFEAKIPKQPQFELYFAVHTGKQGDFSLVF